MPTSNFQLERVIAVLEIILQLYDQGHKIRGQLLHLHHLFSTVVTSASVLVTMVTVAAVVVRVVVRMGVVMGG